MATTQDELIATLQRANAELRRERDAALASRDSRYGEHAAHQAATIEVLKAMSASPGDPQPVFDLICRQARALLDGPSAVLFVYDGELVHLRADRVRRPSSPMTPRLPLTSADFPWFPRADRSPAGQSSMGKSSISAIWRPSLAYPGWFSISDTERRSRSR